MSYSVDEGQEILLREETSGAPTNQLVALDSDGVVEAGGSPNMHARVVSPPTSGMQFVAWPAQVKSGASGAFVGVRSSSSAILAPMA